MKFTVGDGCSRGLCRRGCGRQDRQLNTYDWLADVPGNAESTDLVEVQFKNTRKGYYHNVNALDLKKGDVVAVEASPGHDIGVVTLTGYEKNRSGCPHLASIASALRRLSAVSGGMAAAAACWSASSSSRSPSRNEAKAMASAILPHPNGPQNSMAWGTRPSATSCSSCRLASSCPITSLNFILPI